MRLLLASASPRRAELLRAAGFDFDTVAVDIDEAIRPGERPEDYVQRMASEKSARAIEIAGPAEAGHDRSEGHDEIIVLAADTAVVSDGEILGKPRDDEDAAAMLRRLSDGWHEVMTAVSLRAGPRELGVVEITAVEFALLNDADIAWYVASGEGRDKAGGYAIQGLASRFIPRIEGSYSNVVGLPMASVASLLTEIR